MTRDTKTQLRDLARHQRDEEASRLRRLNQRLAEIEESLVALAGELERAELGMRERLADPFERLASENYLGHLRDSIAGLREQRTNVRRQRDEHQAQLKKRVIEHRQMDHLVTEEMKARDTETSRRDEIESDDLASGHWFQVKEGKGD